MGGNGVVAHELVIGGTQVEAPMVAALGKKRVRYCIEVQYWETQDFILLVWREEPQGLKGGLWDVHSECP